ncbi:unnamed protein product [Ectocarpus sp. 6 AP-2014]
MLSTPILSTPLPFFLLRDGALKIDPEDVISFAQPKAGTSSFSRGWGFIRSSKGGARNGSCIAFCVGGSQLSSQMVLKFLDVGFFEAQLLDCHIFLKRRRLL